MSEKYTTIEEQASYGIGYQMGELQYLLENTITCYEGLIGVGCQKCPACMLRNEGIREFMKTNDDFLFSYKESL